MLCKSFLRAMLEAQQLKESRVNSKETGGPAFPLMGDWSQIKKEGMTLRDYFAAKAALGILAHGYPITRQMDSEKRIAIAAYNLADAMLEARK